MTALNGNRTLEEAVRVADLRAYLLSKGWRVKPFKRTEVVYFEGPPDDDGRPLVLLLPASEHLRDYPLRVAEILKTLGIVESRPVDEIVRNIVTPTSDIIHLRLESPQTRTGTLELRVVEQFFASVKDLIVFAACAQFEPKAFYPRALGRAVQFANKCRYRPAPTGSFRIDVEAPITPPADELQIQLADYPIERRVLTTLIGGLGELQTAIDTGQSAHVLAHPPRRINANMCEAILGMKPDSPDVTWEASVSWSPAWPMDDALVPQFVRFENRAFEQIDAIGRALRVGEKQRQRLLRGKVIRLSGKDPLFGGPGSLTVLLAVESDAAPSNVEIVVDPEQYQIAGLAHLNGQRISVTGILDRIGRKWHLLDVTHFQVLSENPS
jgi:hypothetical protein